jgi:CheY-like chemotaxis protein
MSERDRIAFEAHIEQCQLKAKGIVPRLVAGAMARIAGEAGAPADRGFPTDAGPLLSMDVGGPGWVGVAWESSTRRLFVPGSLAPPAGDGFILSLRVGSHQRPFTTRVRVESVRSSAEAAAGQHAGFTLVLDSAPIPLCDAVARLTPPLEAAGDQRRAAPRYPVHSPVKVSAPVGKLTLVPSPPREAPALPVARIEYDSDADLATDYLENLSQGGAFVRSATPSPVGAKVTLEMRLPGGETLHAPGTVVFASAVGMGVKFELDEDSDTRLAAVIARISARPRRALVVDDDPLLLRMLADALSAHGFEVLLAANAEEGLRIVTEELLTLDLLVTDLRMPGADGATFVRTIRKAGGERDLAIVAAVGTLDASIEGRLIAAGCDAVLEKSIGPGALASAADDALEKKRKAPAT